jgi:hypothetical protein
MGPGTRSLPPFLVLKLKQAVVPDDEVEKAVRALIDASALPNHELRLLTLMAILMRYVHVPERN